MIGEWITPAPKIRSAQGGPFLTGLSQPVRLTKTLAAPDRQEQIVRLEMPLATHRNLRIQAAREDTSMAALARELVEEGLKKKGAKP